MKIKFPNSNFQIPIGNRKLETGNSHKAGYTLIEVLVGLVIVSILFIGGYTSYREFIRRQILESTVKEFKSNLNLTRQKALSGEKPSGCETTLEGYDVTFASTSYTIAARCNPTNPSSSTDTVVNLPNTVTVRTSGFTSPFRFKPVSGTNISTDGTVIFEHTATGVTQNVILKPNGVVE